MMTASAYVKSTKSSKIDDHVISLEFSKNGTLLKILANEHVKHCRRRFIRTFPSSSISSYLAASATSVVSSDDAFLRAAIVSASGESIAESAKQAPIRVSGP